MHEFAVGTLTHPVRRTDGKVAEVTVPVEWPSRIRSGGETYHLEATGYRLNDRRPAALYACDGVTLWHCDGNGYTA